MSWKLRFPTNTEVQRQARRQAERVLRIRREYVHAHVVGKRIAVGEIRHAADHQVRQCVAGGIAVEGELTVRLLVVRGIELLFPEVDSKPELVPAMDQS